jgi:hypothetical protein
MDEIMHDGTVVNVTETITKTFVTLTTLSIQIVTSYLHTIITLLPTTIQTETVFPTTAEQTFFTVVPSIIATTPAQSTESPLDGNINMLPPQAAALIYFFTTLLALLFARTIYLDARISSLPNRFTIRLYLVLTMLNIILGLTATILSSMHQDLEVWYNIWGAHFNCGCDAINTSGALVMFDGIRHNVGVPRNWRHLLEWINGSVATACALLGLLSSISSTYGIKHTSLGKHLSPWPIGLVCWVIGLVTSYFDLRFFWYHALLDDVNDG